MKKNYQPAPTPTPPTDGDVVIPAEDMSYPLEGMALLVIMIDGIRLGGYLLVAALVTSQPRRSQTPPSREPSRVWCTPFFLRGCESCRRSMNRSFVIGRCGSSSSTGR
ncbi:MAG: hypothetical protein LBM23_01240, partial [Propionibacteriaceae bacterium]|nr:hypothetical protein [Propionibacteriaceae bacterium]